MVLPALTSTAPSVHFTHPPRSLFQLPPTSDPQSLSPPLSSRTLSYPFSISPQVYNNALRLEVPATIAVLYAVTVTYLNRVNKERDYKPWAFSKSLTFYILVLAHNVFLALYSGWTFFGMFATIKKSWPGWDGEYGLAGAADALCKMNGPRGLGSAATFNTGTSNWQYTNKAIKLLGDSPDPTDVGRIWNSGLAFYGWLFYLSKFYEVLDTAIILAKGKRSGGLQTYHHTGAMLCMWAGIRFMSPPIWMFVFINSGLHTLMYTYYTLCALTIRVPKFMKQILTGLQITQIVFGCSYAIAHLFVAYDIPIELPYLYVHNLSTALPSTASTLSSAVSSALTSATASAGVANWLKKAALRAAGEEGLAENVRNYQGETFGIDAIHAANVEKAQEEIRYRMGNQRIHCIDTSGQVFAILLNASYLIPLFGLFVRFFYQSYISRVHAGSKDPAPQHNIKESSKDAFKGIEQQAKDDIANEQGGTTEPPPELKAKMEQTKSNVKEGASDLSENIQERAKDLGEKAKEGAKDLGNKAKDAAGDVPANLHDGARNLGEKVTNGVDKAKEFSGNIPAKASEMGQHAKKVGNDVSQSVKDDLHALQDKMKKKDSEEKSPKGNENSQPNGDTKARDKSPEKAPKPREKSPEKRIPVRKDRSPEKKLPASRDKSPEKKSPPSRGISPQKKDVEKPREKSPEKKAPTPRDPSPEKAPEAAEQPTKEPEHEKESSPGLGASGYEVIHDELKTEEEKKAEAEMQPKQE